MKILVTRQIPDAGLKLLKAAGHTLDIYTSDNAIPRAELLKRVKNVDALLSLLTDKIDEEVMQAAGPKLKVIGNYAVGFDNIDLPAAKRHGIAVTNTPAPEVAESVVNTDIRRHVETNAQRRSHLHATTPAPQLTHLNIMRCPMPPVGIAARLQYLRIMR
jgi:lactate dehydrogenase-like 2-hydroxyacid dehydrogenase